MAKHTVTMLDGKEYEIEGMVVRNPAMLILPTTEGAVKVEENKVRQINPPLKEGEITEVI